MEGQKILIGEGATANVYKIVNQGNEYALKQFSKNGKGLKECQIHQQLSHPNIVTYIVGNQDFILCEIMKFDVFKLVQQKKFLNENSGNYIFREIVKGVQYMHSQGIVHRDLKLENILVGNQHQIKICDFGYAENINSGLVKRCVGTETYLAPECYGFDKVDAMTLREADLFQLGVIYFAMLFGHFPFKKKGDALFKLIAGQKWNQFFHTHQKYQEIVISETSKKILQGLLQVKAEQRMSLNEVLLMIGEVDALAYWNDMEQKVRT